MTHHGSLGGYLAPSYSVTNPVASTIVFDSLGVVKLRFVRFMAGAKAHLVPGADHALTMTHFDTCLTAVRSALT